MKNNKFVLITALVVIFAVMFSYGCKKRVNPYLSEVDDPAAATATPMPGSATATATFSNTPTQVVTVAPTSGVTVVYSVIDTFETGTVATNLLGGPWQVQASAGSTALKAAVTDAGDGSTYSCKLSGDVTGAAWSASTLLTYLNGTMSPQDLNASTGIKVYMKGVKGTGTTVNFLLMVMTANIGDYSYWRYTYNPSASWAEITIPWDSFAKPSWGSGLTITKSNMLAAVTGFEWVVTDMTGGTANNMGNEWQIDNVRLYSNTTPTNTPGGATNTPTFTATYTPTVQIEADDPNIQYYGRWDKTDPKNPKASWGAVYIKAKFQGTSVKVRIADEMVALGAEGTGNYYMYSVDGAAFTKFAATAASIYTLKTGLTDTTHDITIVKNTESKWGKMTFGGFILDPGKTLVMPDPRPTRKIEVLGDSITAGLANENIGWYNNNAENGYMSYAPQLARQFNAEWSCLARGGGTFFSDTWLPMRNFFLKTYGPANMEASPAGDNPNWNFASWQPDVFILALGTNDYSTSVPTNDQTAYVNKYKAFLTDLRTLYPAAHIFCMPPFKEVDSGYTGQEWDECRTYISLAVTQMGDANIHYANVYGTLTHPGDYVSGDAYHPNITGDGKLATALYGIIQPIMGW